jgi:FkbM family methyltransferase
MMSKSNDILPLPLRVAVWWNRKGLRGRGVVPRLLGRLWDYEDVFIVTRHGGKLSVDMSNFDVYTHIVNSGGQWEAHVMDVCEAMLRPGDTYYDIGSNTGIFAVEAALAVPNITVFAFEPQPSLAHHIRRSIEVNHVGGIRCLEVMLGQDEGQRDLYVTSHSIHASIVPRENSFKRLRVRMRTLDELVRAGDVSPPDIIKIDVEGGESDVFAGSHEILGAYLPTIIFEADENLLRVKKTAHDLINQLSSHGPYNFFEIKPAGYIAPAEESLPFGNYLALSPRHADRLIDCKREASPGYVN